MERPDILKRFRQHVEFCEKAADCARRGLQHVKAGDMKRAEAAYKQAQRWHQKALALEPKAVE